MNKLTVILFSNLISYSCFAHGTMEYPKSRVYNCFLENPEHPKSDACKNLVNTYGSEALYNWNGINQANANDNHRIVIPDGKLCSGNNLKFIGLDIPRNDWIATDLKNTNNEINFIFFASAKHSTKYFEFYITNKNYDSLNLLKWSDLELKPFCKITKPNTNGNRYQMNCPFPKVNPGKYVIYNIWQRDDSPEAFYTCIDVNILK
ncbi:hypothetical protein GCL60_10960 [Silvanigrella paludirubra]|uniref:Chitin-binding type-4 domain-containing protein n=1 Tax=Silvanigrella paludirubra TaxID=2499159 RepID=A0A6N6VSL4_9BACT|nr:lytic polysaccharide monooxygenase auxiliary activity family 9 protein [Silvanigrella paludirubra]KAB8037686.1 hypothetical protein GCL60_10960 [Silvanigrella paludirubra]